jgi:hypothetical protein
MSRWMLFSVAQSQSVRRSARASSVVLSLEPSSNFPREIWLLGDHQVFAPTVFVVRPTVFLLPDAVPVLGYLVGLAWLFIAVM